MVYPFKDPRRVHYKGFREELGVMLGKHTVVDKEDRSHISYAWMNKANVKYLHDTVIILTQTKASDVLDSYTPKFKF